MSLEEPATVESYYDTRACAGFGLVAGVNEDGVHAVCVQPVARHGVIMFDGWVTVVFLCEAHGALWDADMSFEDAS